MSILEIFPLANPWQTFDPFLFCVHHEDDYPAGNESMGPAASLGDRRIGADFDASNPWRMYHGEIVPGFPQHPHCGFETVTVVRTGLIDHADSLGAAARYGRGDVQWLTTGRGVNHSEMFPLLDRRGPNRLELFQIWLNLPGSGKMAQPHFAMFWDPAIPRTAREDSQGRSTTVKVIAGELGDTVPPQPPPESWAAQPGSDVAIWEITMDPGAHWSLPPSAPGTNRAIYFYRGSNVIVDGRNVAPGNGVALGPGAGVHLENGPDVGEFLVLQGRPIGEPVAQHGPFVMNSREELQQAFVRYQQTQFGGWPWPNDAPVHPPTEGRFARHADGRIERP